MRIHVGAMAAHPSQARPCCGPGEGETGRKREAGYLPPAESPLGEGQSLPYDVCIAMNVRIRDPAKVGKNMAANSLEAV